MLNPQIGNIFRAIYRRLGKNLQNRFWRVMGYSMLVAVAEFVLTAAVSLLGVVLASPQTIAQSRIMLEAARLFPVLQPVTEDPRLLLIVLLSGLCVAVLCKSLALALLTWQQASFSQAVNLDMGERLFHSFVHAPYLWHVEQRVSDLTTYFNWRNSVGAYCFAAVQVLGQAAVTVLLVLVVLLASPLAGMVVLTGTGISAYGIFRLSRKLVNKCGQELAIAQRDSARVSHTALYGIRELIIYRQQRPFECRFVQHEARISLAQSRLPVWHPLPSWTLEWTGMALLLGAVVLLYWQEAGVARTVGTLTLLAAVAWRLLPTTNKLVQQLLIMQQQVAQINPVLQKLDAMSTLLLMHSDAVQDCPLRESLCLEDVSFRYPSTPDEKPDAVRHLNLRIPRGSMVGFVGASGAGKSTIVGLLTGLFPPTGGQMAVDGQEMDSALREGWIRRIGYVPQSPFLLHASIAENVAFSHWGAVVDRERVRQCCRMAAMDFVDELEQGIDTVIGERGVRLSGGQVQRVAIARALYNEPQFILFDEATSALDGAAEQAIQQTINNLRNHLTLVVVAHRLSTVESCDYVYWVDNGEIKRHGTTHDVLREYKEFLSKKSPGAERDI